MKKIRVFLLVSGIILVLALIGVGLYILKRLGLGDTDLRKNVLLRLRQPIGLLPPHEALVELGVRDAAERQKPPLMTSVTHYKRGPVSESVKGRTKAYLNLKRFLKWAYSNKIPVFARHGLLLGTVRHTGFIPYDYDVDLGMFEKDLSRLQALDGKDGVTITTEDWNNWPWMKPYPAGVRIASVHVSTPDASEEIVVFGKEILRNRKGYFYYQDAKQHEVEYKSGSKVDNWTIDNVEEGGRYSFPFFPEEVFEPLVLWPFYDTFILAHKQSVNILKKLYGDECLRVAINKCASVHESDDRASKEETERLRGVCHSMKDYSDFQKYGARISARLVRRGEILLSDKKSCDTSLTYDQVHPLSKAYITPGMYMNEDKLWKKGDSDHPGMDHVIQTENLLLLKQFLEHHDISYYIDCGTLLGAVREKGLIRGDQDADIQVAQDDLHLIRDNLHFLENMGFIAWRNKDNGYMALSLLRKGEYVDIYRQFQKIPFKLVGLSFLGSTFPVPEHYEEYLDEIYGDWRTPSNGNTTKAWEEQGIPEYIRKYGTGPVEPVGRPA